MDSPTEYSPNYGSDTVFGTEISMPLPIIALALGAAAGSTATKKNQKTKAVSGYKKKSGTKVKAYTRRPGGRGSTR